MPNAYIIVSELVSILFLSIVLLGMLLQGDKKSITAKLYILSVAASIFACFADMISYWLEGTLHSVFLLTVINVFALGGTTFVMAAFVWYVWAWLNEKKPINRWYALVTSLVCISDFLLVVIGAIVGKMFTIENGAYVAGSWETANGVLQVVILLVFLGFILSKWHNFGTHAALILCLYVVLPSVTAILQWTLVNGSYVYVAIALDMVLIYVSIQRDALEKGRLREKIMLEVSNTDALTRLNNRRAYDTCLSSLGADTRVGVLFCDLNGLKNTNDRFGHAAGDALIQRFADLLREHFAASEVYRISGDEFVMISQDAESRLRPQIDAFLAKNADLGKISAVGSAFGTGDQVMNLLREAEKAMYIDKDQYYQERGGRDRV